MTDNEPYILRINDVELERLRFQHSVWKKVSDDFFDRLGVGAGWKCLDAGAGPGFVANDLRERVGASGEVTALEPAEYYLDYFKQKSAERGWKNIKFIHGSAETAELPKNYFDLIYIRWVLCFVPDPDLFVRNLVSSLKPDGIIAIQDYLYAGLGLYPNGGAFDHALETVVAHWKLRGGDAFIAGRIPKIFRENGLELVDYSPHVQATGPETDVFEWAHRYFTVHLPIMAEDGVTTKELADAMVADWNAHKKNPDTIFCSPIVVDMAGRKM
ncbi:MAG TPA: methyltransferase domain-containing protein [Candidatus Kapabacteria bacterium]|nr:methyltransferase domain-containing protein [Candidatus Kapabacteria bacterium]